MKIQNITNVDSFFDTVQKCKGKVELVSPEGDRLNLKSKLTQYLAIAEIFSGGYIRELELVVYNREDIDLLINYMMEPNR